jgi:hypothetical protein
MSTPRADQDEQGERSACIAFSNLMVGSAGVGACGCGWVLVCVPSSQDERNLGIQRTMNTRTLACGQRRQWLVVAGGRLGTKSHAVLCVLSNNTNKGDKELVKTKSFNWGMWTSRGMWKGTITQQKEKPGGKKRSQLPRIMPCTSASCGRHRPLFAYPPRGPAMALSPETASAPLPASVRSPHNVISVIQTSVCPVPT